VSYFTLKCRDVLKVWQDLYEQFIEHFVTNSLLSLMMKNVDNQTACGELTDSSSLTSSDLFLVVVTYPDYR